jgi:hypothetical protein
MRRALSIRRASFAVLVALGLFGTWAWFFRSEVQPPPQYVVRTGALHERGEKYRSTSTWTNVEHVSDDGSRVTIGVHRGGFRWVDTKLQLWDTRTGMNETPRLWQDEEWSKLLSGHHVDKRGLMHLLGHPSGRQFLSDEAAWTRLLSRLAALGEQIEPSRICRPLPQDAWFSPDGKYMAYEIEFWFPCCGVPEPVGNWMLVEEVTTGKRVALLPDVWSELKIAPGGQTAVSGDIAFMRDGEQPHLQLWDLQTSSLRATLRIPGDHPRLKYSSDGQYVFVHYWIPGRSSRGLKWWDANAGRQIGFVAHAADWAAIDNGRVMVTHPSRERKRTGTDESYRLQFWDVATGVNLGDWDLSDRSDGGGMIDELVGSEGGRYLAGEYSPDAGVGRSPGGRIADGVASIFGDDDWYDRRQILIWDVLERRELARLPGKSAAFSGDGQWLATIDEHGTLRVWELPVRRPWGRILGWAAIASLGCLAVLIVLARAARRLSEQGTFRRVRQRAAWCWSSKSRRRWSAGVVGSIALMVGGLTWYSFAVDNARREMEAVFEQIDQDTTEADVTAMVGRPPDDGPLRPIPNAVSGGQSGVSVTGRQWRRYGTEMEVHFGENGTVTATFINRRPAGFLEGILNWLGW